MAMFDGEQTSEYGYLIESGDPKTPRYFSIKSEPCYSFWSQDAYDAIRFSRKIDAEKFLVLMSLKKARVVEHCFVDNEDSNERC